MARRIKVQRCILTHGSFLLRQKRTIFSWRQANRAVGGKLDRDRLAVPIGQIIRTSAILRFAETEVQRDHLA